MKELRIKEKESQRKEMAKKGFKGIPGFPLYMINEKGEVYSFARIVPRKKDVVVTKGGYCKVLLSNNGKRYDRFVHRLVCLTYLNNPQNKPAVNHKNGIKTDNNLSNLEWCYTKENIDHAIASGLMNTKGLNNGNCKMTEEKLICIKVLMDHNISVKSIMDLLSLPRTTLFDYKRKFRKNYFDIDSITRGIIERTQRDEL